MFPSEDYDDDDNDGNDDGDCDDQYDDSALYQHDSDCGDDVVNKDNI